MFEAVARPSNCNTAPQALGTLAFVHAAFVDAAFVQAAFVQAAIVAQMLWRSGYS